MPSYTHNKIIQKILKLDRLPTDPAAFNEWIPAEAHLDFLRDNAREDEVVIYASGPYAYIYSMVVPNSALFPLDEADLLAWSVNPYRTSAAGYVTGGGREGMWVERGISGIGSETLDRGSPVIFGREFHGWKGPGSRYIEVVQEYSHLSGIHWRPEERAYCLYDDNGDLHHSVSITVGDGSGGVSLVTFDWKQLEPYLAATDSSLVRMFDFMLLDHGNFSDWGDGEEKVFPIEGGVFYRQKVVPDVGAYTRGVQLLGLRRSPSEVFKSVTDNWGGSEARQHAEFIAHDFRNNVIVKISTDPAATTNYFDASSNKLPFELSPAFFKPEVLLKYKADRDKYAVEDRSITCRNAWYLRGYDVNAAGQVHAYICDLRALPYNEQLHWLSYNQAPKEGISERAYVNDFKGEFTQTEKPLQKVTGILNDWDAKRVSWWKMREPNLIERVTVPYSASRDEWADAFMDLAKLVNEGFEVQIMRQRLNDVGAGFEQKDQSITLLEKLASHSMGHDVKFSALRLVQRIRSKVKGHAGSSEAAALSQEALAVHGSFAKHFESVATDVASELVQIEKLFQGVSR